MAKYAITVKTGSSQEKIIESKPNEIIVYLRAKPHDGEANTALVKVLSKYFKVPKTTIKITSGAKSHFKRVEF